MPGLSRHWDCIASPDLGLHVVEQNTMHFYVTVEKFERIEFPKPPVPEIKQEIAPYNGFGSVEDSMASCLNLIPKAPRRYNPILHLEFHPFIIFGGT